jgi:hypothetical protein
MATTELTLPGLEIHHHRCGVIGQGTFGYIENLGDFRLPQIDQPLVLKRFKKGIPPVATASLRQIPKVRVELDEPWRNRWDDLTLWPLRVVTDSKNPSRARGIIMRRLPDEYMFDLRLPSGTKKIRVRDLEWAAVGKETAVASGVHYLSGPERVDLLRKLSYTLAMLHSAKMIYGDLSYGNVAFRRDSKGEIWTQLMDCDSTVAIGQISPFLRQAHTGSFTPPEKIRDRQNLQHAVNTEAPEHEIKRLEHNWARQSAQTDSYKFGLLVMRITDNGDDRTANFDPTVACARLGKIPSLALRASLSHLPSDRPSMSEWYKALGGTASSDTSHSLRLRPARNSTTNAPGPQQPTNPPSSVQGGVKNPLITKGRTWIWDQNSVSWKSK